MMVQNEKFTAFIEEFTTSTYIMVICSDQTIEQEAIALNIKASKDYFEAIMQSFMWYSPTRTLARDKAITNHKSIHLLHQLISYNIINKHSFLFW